MLATLPLLLLSILAPAASQNAPAAAAPAPPAGRITVPHERYRLDNGLDVILAPDHSLPKVEVNLWYRVGSKDEPLGRSGFAHLFEHLMFMGTNRVPNSEFDSIMEAGGGANNATTSEDRTNYFDWGPAPMLETLLWLEADRLESLDEAMTQEKLDLQRDVVRNERRQSIENQPYGKAEILVDELMYPPGHPYQISVIGKHEDLQAATVSDVKSFFNRYYLPNNASLCVVGDFDPAQAKQWIQQEFGDLPPGPEPPPVDAPPARLDGPRRITLEDKVELARLSFVYHSPAFFKPGDAEMDIVGSALSEGTNSRLYQRLVVKDGLAVDVAAYQASRLLGSLFHVDVMAAPGADLAALEAAVDDELGRLLSQGLEPGERERTVARIETNSVRSLESLHARADRLNQYLMAFGDPDGFERDLDRYRRATDEGVAAWARSVLDPQRRLVMTVLPEGSRAHDVARDRRPAEANAAPAFDPPVPSMSRRESGLEVWHLQRTGLPLVAISLVLPNGAITETPEQAGLATLAASMMEEGAGDLDSRAFAQALQQLGADFSVTAGLRQTIVQLNVLEEHLDEALALFHEAVARPRFDAADFERVRRLQAESLRQALDDPGTVARQVGARLWYGERHPYGRPVGGFPETVEKLALEQAREFQAGLAQPKGALLVMAGDLDPARARAVADALDQDWPKAAHPLPAVPASTPAAALQPPRAVLVDRPDAPQTVVSFIMPGQAGTDPERIPADVLNSLFGGSFTSRLNQNLREDKGYTYGARSGFTRRPDQGTFGASADVRTDVTGASLKEFLGEFERARGADIAPDEVAGATSTVRARIVSGYESLGSTVGTWLTMRERGNVPADAAQDLAKLAGVTPAEINELVGRLIPTDHLLLVLVGDRRAVLPQLEGLALPPIDIVDEHGEKVPEGIVPAAGTH